MEVKFIYFGMIAEKIGETEESVILSNNESDIRKFVISKYPELEAMSFTIAINQELRDKVSQGEQIKEIALLPPFAGG